MSVAEKYMGQREKAEGLGDSSLDDSLVNLTGTIFEFCGLYYNFVN